MADKPAVNIICSDRARNGKTLLARLMTDWLTLSGEQAFVIDLDAPDAPLAARYPAYSLAADFSRVGGRVAVFDTIIGAPERDFIIDLPARELESFFREAAAIAFFEEAERAGMEVVLFFVVDRALASIRHARELAAAHPAQRLFPVRNGFIGDLLDDEEASELYLDLYLKGELALPKLSPESMATVEGARFSFRDFSLGRIEAPNSFQHYEISEFCDTVFSQFGKLRFRLDMEGLKDMGLI